MSGEDINPKERLRALLHQSDEEPGTLDGFVLIFLRREGDDLTSHRGALLRGSHTPFVAQHMGELADELSIKFVSGPIRTHDMRLGLMLGTLLGLVLAGAIYLIV